MTLILCVAAPQVVLQVSDRRFVWLRADGTSQRRDDDANKALFYQGHIAFAFTGLAEVGPRRQRTDQWMAEVLSPTTGQAQALEALATAATERFQHPLIKQLPGALRRHEFVGVGWTRFPPDHDHFEPYIAVASNCRSDTGELIEAQERFRWRIVRTTEDHEVMGFAAGQTLDDEAQAEIQDGMAAYARGALTVLGLAEAMVGCVGGMADRNDLVGHGLMLNCIPRVAVENPPEPGVFLASGPMDEVTTFLSIRPDDPTGTLVGPIFVGGGGQGMIMSFEATSLDHIDPSE